MTRRKRKALGKGLEELFPAIDENETGTSASEVHIELIDPNPFQPRKEWKTEDISSLAASIRSQGILQPLILRRSGGRYQLIAGERRLRAAKEVGLKAVPAVIRKADDEQMLALALVENIQREDLGPMEKAEAFKRLSVEFNLTQDEMGKRVGMSRSAVANFQRLLDLPAAVQKLLREGKLHMGHGRALLGLNNPGMQTRMAVLACRRDLSVRQLEERVRRSSGSQREGAKRKNNAPSVEKQKLEEELQRIMKTKVRITGSAKNGRIEITYHSLEELDRLIDILKAGDANS